MNSTVVVQLTGSGRAAVASLLVAGPAAVATVLRCFESRALKRNDLIQNKTYFGVWAWKAYAEELVVCRTGDQQVEVHCHGGRMAVHMVIESLVSQGIRKVSSLEWLEYAEPDRFRREALALLPTAKTERVLCILLDQVRGAMRRELKQIQGFLQSRDFAAAAAAMRRIVDCGQVGVRLDRPFSVPLIGRPNAGKSSLMNALVGYDRAIVFDQPGTTRDLVRVETALDGWAILFVDTAGLRDSDDRVEQAGVQLAIQTTKHADLILEVQDVAAASDEHDSNARLPIGGIRRLVVATKSDLPHAVEQRQACDVLTSSKTGQGIADLCNRIVTTLIPLPPRKGDAVPLTNVTLAAVKEILAALEAQQVDTAEALIQKLLD